MSGWSKNVGVEVLKEEKFANGVTVVLTKERFRNDAGDEHITYYAETIGPARQSPSGVIYPTIDEWADEELSETQAVFDEQVAKWKTRTHQDALDESVVDQRWPEVVQA